MIRMLMNWQHSVLIKIDLMKDIQPDLSVSVRVNTCQNMRLILCPIAKLRFLMLVSLILCAYSFAQTNNNIEIVVAADKANRTYKVGEVPEFKIEIKGENIPPIEKLNYEVGQEKQVPEKKGEIYLHMNKAELTGISLSSPGFITLRLWFTFEGKTYEKKLNTAISPEKIRPVTPLPEDFFSFWECLKAESDSIPLDAHLELWSEKSTGKLDVYLADFRNYRNRSRIYGVLCIPKKPGKYPVLLRLPGSGIHSFTGDTVMANKGVITFEIGIHGIPVNLNKSVYGALSSGPLNGYRYNELDNRERYYFNRVYMGCYRAISFLTSLPRFDGKNVIVYGRSQGGALSIVTAALHPEVTLVAAYFPALCDLHGYLHNRGGGWPHMFSELTPFTNSPEKIKTAPYFDVVNFAQFVKAKGYYCFGYNDFVCPPTSMYAAYNMIKSDKFLNLQMDTGHAIYPELWKISDQWIIENLK
jgi:cephalosporin-C deacetylase